MVRLLLEYGATIWYPRFIADVEILENVQRRATKLMPYFRELSYEERLKKLKLPTLVYRRLRGDMVEAYKLTHHKLTMIIRNYSLCLWTTEPEGI